MMADTSTAARSATLPADSAGTDEGVDREGLGRRLNRIEGQVRGIRRMIDDGRPCLEILQQVAAARAALGRISLAVVRHHVDYCVAEGLPDGDGDTRRRLNELVDIFDRFDQ